MTKLFVAVALLFAGVACTTDATEDLGVVAAGQTEIALSLESSRTQLGEKADGVYPLYWSEGDKILVNGVASESLSASDEGKANATFVVNGTVAYPYNIVTPAAEGVSSLTSGCYPVLFPAEQSYKAGNVDGKAVVMYGYAEEGEAPTLYHLTGILRFEVKGAVTLSNLTVASTYGALAGTYDVNCSTGALTAQSGSTSDTVTLSFGDGLTLGAEPTPIYVAVPAGEYGEVVVTLNTTSGEKMVVKFNTEGKPVVAGKVREFAAFEFAANATDDVFVIDSKEALLAFAANPTKSALVTANIDMTGETWTTITEYGAYTFDGGNYEIKGLNAPLFGTTYANIKNVKLVDVNYEETTNAFSGAIACVLYGTMNNCSVSGNITINNTTYAGNISNYADVGYAGVVGSCVGATMTNCTNNAKITLVSLVGNTTCAVTAGGVVGGASQGCKFDGLVNNGDIIFSGSAPANFYLSGVIGRAVPVTDTIPFTELNNCTNNGNITQTAESVCGKDLLIGGITGTVLSLDKTYVFSNLKNTGNITLAGKSRYAYGSGIVSYTATSSFDNCSNSGNISIATGAKATSGKLIGLVYEISSGGSVKNCHNTGALSVGDDITFNHLVKLSGIVDTMTGEGALMENCTNSGTLSVGYISNTLDGNNGRLYMAGLASTVNSGVLKNCHNHKSAKFTVNANNFVYGFMIGGLVGYFSAVASIVDQVNGLEDCSNSADIDIKAEAASAVYAGGILGQLWSNKVDLTTSFLRVNNSGNISLGGVCTCPSNILGGITAYILSEMNYEDCHNTGDITFATTGDAGYIYQGGFVGFSSHRTQNSSNGSNFTNCSNSGKVVAKPTNVTGNANIGGFVGRSIPGGSSYVVVGEEFDYYTNCSNSGVVEVSGSGTINSLWAAHFAGYMQQGSMLTDCTATTSSKIDLSIAKVTSYAITGWIAHCQQYSGGDKYSFLRCSNYGTIEASSKGLPAFYHSGLVGANYEADIKLSGSMTVDATDCVVKTTVNFTGTTAGAFAHGGFCRYPYGASSTYTIKNFKNESTVNVLGKVGKNIESGGLGGYISATLIVDKDTEVKENFNVAGTVGTYVGYGGYWGNINQGNQNDKYEGTYSGNLTLTGTIGTNIVVGGIGGQHKNPINLDNTVSAGTIRLGTPEKPLTINGTYVRVGGISCGSATSYDSSGFVHILNNVKNFTDITVENTTIAETVTTFQVGGIYGHCPSPVEGATSYCTLKVVNIPNAQVGIFSGSARSATSLATNCKFGGIFVGEYDEEDEAYKEYTLDESNFHNYIYGSGALTDWGESTNYDGCTVLTSKPSIL